MFHFQYKTSINMLVILPFFITLDDLDMDDFQADPDDSKLLTNIQCTPSPGKNVTKIHTI